MAAKSALRADESPFGGFTGVNPDQNAMHFASAGGKFCYCKIWVKLNIRSEKIQQLNAENGHLSLKEAETFTRKWIDKQSITANDLRAFPVRRVELLHLLERMAADELDAVRFYIGMKPKTTDEEVLQPCLIMAGVKGFEVNFNAPQGPIVTNVGKEEYFTGRSGNEAEDESTYDFSYPCPDTCQLDSPLMNPPLHLPPAEPAH